MQVSVNLIRECEKQEECEKLGSHELWILGRTTVDTCEGDLADKNVEIPSAEFGYLACSIYYPKFQSSQ